MKNNFLPSRGGQSRVCTSFSLHPKTLPRNHTSVSLQYPCYTTHTSSAGWAVAVSTDSRPFKRVSASKEELTLYQNRQACSWIITMYNPYQYKWILLPEELVCASALVTWGLLQQFKALCHHEIKCHMFILAFCPLSSLNFVNTVPVAVCFDAITPPLCSTVSSLIKWGGWFGL